MGARRRPDPEEQRRKKLDARLKALVTAFPEALASVLGMPASARFVGSSRELKEAGGRVDAVLAPVGRQRLPHILIELQLRHDADTERSLLRKVILYAKENPDAAQIRAIVIYGSRAIRRTSLPADLRGPSGLLVRFRPTRIVLPWRPRLRAGHPPSAAAILPLLVDRAGVERGLGTWYGEIRSVKPNERRWRLLNLLLAFATERHDLTVEQLEEILMAQSKLPPDIEELGSWAEAHYLRGEAAGEAQGEARGHRRAIRSIVHRRFGKRPRWLSVLNDVDDADALARLVTDVAVAPDLDRVRRLVERASNGNGKPPRKKGRARRP